MKKILTLALAALIIMPFVGYYEHQGEIGSTPVFFIKKKPTLKMKFHRIFHPNFEKSLHEITALQRQQVIDYCKYRLGIETRLETEEEFNSCWDE
ncbi:hypothetical protein PSCICN_45320 [Pseudomonas cichorii]|uniref:hypothetical protein n=1 Tax=Pseudomonas cichorii TaxID=36746 RepID=UPI0019F11140|nr:hypothetical protein [Pseudomonas cichorii]GFM83840.1 hypothetical protein PSCICN_45320 [Pseudomonas cichorii]